MHLPSLVELLSRGNGVNCSTAGWGFQHLVEHWAPLVVKLVSTPETKVSEIDQPAHLQRGLSNMPIMSFLPLTCSGQQPTTSILKCHSEPCLMLGHPVLYVPWLRVLDPAQKKVHREPGLSTKHQEER
jgi:hypothetical protein